MSLLCSFSFCHTCHLLQHTTSNIAGFFAHTLEAWCLLKLCKWGCNDPKAVSHLNDRSACICQYWFSWRSSTAPMCEMSVVRNRFIPLYRPDFMSNFPKVTWVSGVWSGELCCFSSFTFPWKELCQHDISPWHPTYGWSFCVGDLFLIPPQRRVGRNLMRSGSVWVSEKFVTVMSVFVTPVFQTRAGFC